jgi:hypothetical protein
MLIIKLRAGRATRRIYVELTAVPGKHKTEGGGGVTRNASGPGRVAERRCDVDQMASHTPWDVYMYIYEADTHGRYLYKKDSRMSSCIKPW